MKNQSVKIAILIPALSVLIAGIIMMVITVSSISSSTAYDLTSMLISSKVNEYTNEFKALCLESYGAVVSLAPVVEDIAIDSDNPREQVLKIMQSVLETNKNMLGIWTCWEPNAFDGNDSQYANTLNHDATGRFIPYVYRDGAGYGVEALKGYDSQADGDYYFGARNSKKPYITDPFAYTVGTKTISLYSIAIPIIIDGSVAGVVGADISLENVVSAMNAGSILDDGYLFIISPSGLFASHKNTDLLLADYKTTWLGNYSPEIQSVLSNGGNFSITSYSDQLNEDVILLASGILIGDTAKHWTVCGVVPQRTVAASSTMLLWVVIGIGLVLTVIVGLTVFLLVHNNLRELPKMTEMAEMITKGDINIVNLESGNEQTKNEIKLLGRSFVSMVNSIKSQSDIMSEIAEGNYSVQISMRSDGDIMNGAIADMLNRTNETMTDIRSASGQVSEGSKQIAEGAQTLAQGATEQAATVEQLSSTLNEISEKTRISAEMAEKAVNLTGTIKSSAEKGNAQMDRMMDAVNEINQAGRNISKITKDIEDIAFQTNILALNAAVEAARAGEAGKGFAVVADEVRNLATKSADAAKNTAKLISDSNEKTKLGAKIAEETSVSLKEIASEISVSNEVISEIKRFSEEQTISISQINEAIEQVSQVIQQNSATAQESAAASEEMNGQAEMMTELVERFKLR